MAWYDNAGAIDNCLAAYDAIGAASLADSYTDETGNGYTAAPGTAPDWANGTGWTFNGTDDYLTLGGLPATTKPMSFIVRLTPTSTDGLQAPITSDANGGYAIDADWGEAANKIRFLKKNIVNIGSSTTDAPASGAPVVLAVTYSAAGVWTHYRNGAADGTGTNDQTPTAGTVQWLSGQASRFYKGVIAAVAFYGDVLSAAEVAALTTNINALPSYSEGGKGLPVIAWEHARVFGA